MKKLVSVFLALVMLLGMMGSVAFADETPSFVVSSVEGDPGEEIEVTVSVVNNPGVSGIDFDIKYDSTVLELTKITQGIFPGFFGKDIAAGNVYWFYSDDESEEDNFYEDGVFCTLKFTIKEDAVPGTSTPITLTYDENNVYYTTENYEEENVYFDKIEGLVTVTGETPEPIQDGFYLAGMVNGEETWNPADFTAERLFVPNPSADTENESLLETTLAVGDNFKVVKVVNGEITDYYPPEGGNYYVTDAYAGDVTIYFKNGNWVEGWADFGYYFYIQKGFVPFAEVYGVNASLGGDIGLNFFLELPEAFLNETDAYAEITTEIGKGGTTKLTEAKTRETEEGTTIYQFGVKLSAKEMNEPVTLRLYKADGTPMALRNNGEDLTNTGYTFSIHDYVEKAIEVYGDTDLTYLLKTMSDFGTTAQRYLGYKPETAPDLYNEAEITGLDPAVLAEYERVVEEGEPAGLTFKGFSCTMGSESAINAYFELEEGHSISEFVFRSNGRKVTPVKTSDGYRIKVTNIGSKKLDKIFTFTVTTKAGGAEVYTLQYSVLGYAYDLMTKTTDDAAKNLGAALYLYSNAAHACFG